MFLFLFFPFDMCSPKRVADSPSPPQEGVGRDFSDLSSGYVSEQKISKMNEFSMIQEWETFQATYGTDEDKASGYSKLHSLLK